MKIREIQKICAQNSDYERNEELCHELSRIDEGLIYHIDRNIINLNKNQNPNLNRYASPFRIIDSDGNTLIKKSDIHHLKAKFDEYLFDNKDNLKYPYIVVDTACHDMMVVDENTGYKEWRHFLDMSDWHHDH